MTHVDAQIEASIGFGEVVRALGLQCFGEILQIVEVCDHEID